MKKMNVNQVLTAAGLALVSTAAGASGIALIPEGQRVDLGNNGNNFLGERAQKLCVGAGCGNNGGIPVVVQTDLSNSGNVSVKTRNLSNIDNDPILHSSGCRTSNAGVSFFILNWNTAWVDKDCLAAQAKMAAEERARIRTMEDAHWALEQRRMAVLERGAATAESNARTADGQLRLDTEIRRREAATNECQVRGVNTFTAITDNATAMANAKKGVIGDRAAVQEVARKDWEAWQRLQQHCGTVTVTPPSCKADEIIGMNGTCISGVVTPEPPLAQRQQQRSGGRPNPAASKKTELPPCARNQRVVVGACTPAETLGAAKVVDEFLAAGKQKQQGAPATPAASAGAAAKKDPGLAPKK